MKIEFLGSGGAFTTPLPGRKDRVNSEARREGVPYSRTGPGVFIHEASLLIDTAEEIKYQLNRAKIFEVKNCLYSHWHPDHTAGRRVFEALNWDTSNYPPQHRTSNIFIPQQVALDFRERLGLWENFQYFQRMGFVDVHELKDGETIHIKGIDIFPFRVSEDYVYAFILTEGDTRILIAPDELFGWEPPDFAQGVDLAIMPMGIPEFHPLTEERAFPENHPVWKEEASHAQTLAMVKVINAKRTILHHVEAVFDMSYDDYLIYEERLADEGYENLSFAYDTQVVEV